MSQQQNHAMTAMIDPTELTDSAATEGIAVRAEELIVGRSLTYPICDPQGVLLLASGATITPRFFDLLKQHNVDQVRIHPDDVGRATLLKAAIARSSGSSRFDAALTQKLDKLIDSGSLFVANSGPSVRENLVIHGCGAYDPEQRESLLLQHQSTGESLDNMMREAMHGQSVDLSQISGISARYLTQMTIDCDSVLTVASEAGKDDVLSSHCLQMALMGMAIGVELGLDERNVRNIGLCGLVHDWGMVQVPAKIRKSPHPLTPNEYLEVQRHPIFSLELLQQVAGIPTVVPLVAYQVHESPNGEGYPRGRRGNSIHLFARILKVADAYVALTSTRPYRPRMMPYSAMELLLRKAKLKAYDPQVVRALLHVVSLFPIGSLCALSDGSVARVLRSNREAYTTPVVQLVQHSDGSEVNLESEDSILDLRQHELSIRQALPVPGSSEIGMTPEVLEPRRVPSLACRVGK